MQLQRKRLWLLSVIGGVCLTVLLIILFAQNMHSSSPNNSSQIIQTDSLTISCDELSALLRHKLSDYLPVGSFDISLSPNGTVTLNAAFKKSDVIQYLENRQSSLRHTAVFLPDPIDTHLILSITQTEKGIWVEPTDFHISKLELTSLLTPELTETINAAISRYFDESGINILSFRILSDAISINIKHHLA